MSWPPPSNRVRDLIRAGAQQALEVPDEWLDELDRATLSGDTMRAIAADPVLSASTRRTNRSNLLFWAAANIRDPGAPVPANLGPEPLAIARDLVRRGLDESALDSYRVGQNLAWRRWMQIAFALTSDPDELRELLDVSAQSIAGFLDATVAAISARMRAERHELTHGTQAERREVLALVLDGAPITRERAEARLAYSLTGEHTAAVVWSDEPDVDLTSLDRVAEAMAQAAQARPLSVIASAATRWVWTPGPPRVDAVRAALKQAPAVRVALAGPGRDVEGFRRTHLDALITQRLLDRIGSAERLATYSSVALVSLVTEDSERAARFVKDTLGDLESADADIRKAVLTFVNEQCNAVRAADRLFTHRNTVLRRLARAESLLPRPLAANSVDVAVALDIVRWRGTP